LFVFGARRVQREAKSEEREGEREKLQAKEGSGVG